MDNSLFYINFEPNEKQSDFIDQIKDTICSESREDNVNPVYVIRKPMIEKNRIMTITMHLLSLFRNTKLCF